MNYEVFVEHVQRRADLPRTEAEGVSAVVLETLGELLDAEQRKQVTAQLPVELKPLMARRRTDRIGLEEFYNRVRARADVGTPQAVAYSKAVAMTLQEALSPAEMDLLLSWLPHEYAELFNRSEPGPESLSRTGAGS